MNKNSRSIRSDEYVLCKFCDKELQRITGTHLVVHEMTRQEYMEQFGLSPDQLTAKALRRRMAKRKDYRPLTKAQMLKLVGAMLKKHPEKGAGYFEEHHYQVFAQASKMFGGWRKAAEAAGLETRLGRRARIWTRDKVLSEIRSLHARTGTLALAKQESEHNRILLLAALRHFGKWKSAIQAAGFDLRDLTVRQNWSKARIVVALRKSKRRDTLSEREFFLLTKASIKQFGSFEHALEAAGFTWEGFFQRNRWDRSSILTELRTYKERYGDGCSCRIKREAPELVEASRRHFNRWSEALVKAGIKLPFKNWTKDLFRAEAQRLLKGKPTNSGWVAKNHPILLHPAKKFYGSWEAAVKAAGLEWRSKRPWNEERVLEVARGLAIRGSLQGADSRADPALKRAIYYYFGNWDTVARKLGLKYQPRNV